MEGVGLAAAWLSAFDSDRAAVAAATAASATAASVSTASAGGPVFSQNLRSSRNYLARHRRRIGSPGNDADTAMAPTVAKAAPRCTRLDFGAAPQSRSDSGRWCDEPARGAARGAVRGAASEPVREPVRGPAREPARGAAREVAGLPGDAVAGSNTVRLNGGRAFGALSDQRREEGAAMRGSAERPSEPETCDRAERLGGAAESNDETDYGASGDSKANAAIIAGSAVSLFVPVGGWLCVTLDTTVDFAVVRRVNFDGIPLLPSAFN